ncbi:MAG: nitroreductase family protein [Alphaproteobacteria bacterium]|nr:nitroreductase family protein [Alphaproteobacteria bacterium]MDE2336795.1 nitroreductase family protein [Alphaproteobacteria bacterium]
MPQQKIRKPPAAETGHAVNVMPVIRQRRAVRHYKPQLVGRDAVKALLSAAVQAPTAMREEAWSFAVIQDAALLKEISDAAKELTDPETRTHLSALFHDPNFNIFYNAGTLVVICGRQAGRFVAADCWLAAENLMLAACAMGLGSCVIGLAVDVLNMPVWKARLGIPADVTAYAPLILGVPEGETPAVPRKAPKILSWASS